MATGSMVETVPPSDLEAEMAVLGSILNDGHRMDDVAPILTARAFYKSAHRKLYEVLREVHERGDPIDPILVANEAERDGRADGFGGREYLGDLVRSVKDPTHADRYAWIVLEKSAERDVICATHELRQAASEGALPDAVAKGLAASLRRLAAARKGRTGLAGPLTESYDEETDLAEDWAIEGLLERGDVGALYGVPKAGKTTLAFAIAADLLFKRELVCGVWRRDPAWKPERILVLTEMSRKKARRQFVRMYDPRRELVGRVRFVTMAGRSAIRSGHFSVGDLITRAAAEAGPFDLVLVDTLTTWALIAGGEDLNGAGDVGRFIGEIRDACETFGSAALLVAHARKSANETDVTPSDILGSGGGVRGQTDANIGASLLDEESTLVKVVVEARDSEGLVTLAKAATMKAKGMDASADFRKRCWYLRLDWHDDRVRYIEAEDELVERFESSRETVTREAKAGRGDVRACVNEALVRLTRDAAIHGKARVFPKRTISKEAKLLWDLRGGAPDFAPSVRVTEKILDEHLSGVVHVRRPSYPDNGRAGGYGIALHLPKPLGDGHDPDPDPDTLKGDA